MVRGTAKSLGLEFSTNRERFASTLKSHALLEFAKETAEEKQDSVAELLFKVFSNTNRIFQFYQIVYNRGTHTPFSGYLKTLKVVPLTILFMTPLARIFYLLIYKPSYCDFPESRNKINFNF